ncbi:DUF3303 family protein [Actinomadura verrucosospora]|uniref:DUF3303 domain-containing protein n=1 Tax=Actinomadura verrucosospora TaxID=46165 RepID=A0A7D3ZJX4_ACTVE|nr:DUF3303 family protein [Actinomadura verrucosospora]QKG25817.1 hypothetical protein ACTIVE_7469 [Actinomadura verrucosospora]
MRVMLQARMDTRMGNEALKNGTLQQTMQALVEKLKPEAAYFSPSDGKRSCTIVFDMQDSSQIPTIVEPLFTALGAEIEIVPVMNLDDLRKGLAAL